MIFAFYPTTNLLRPSSLGNNQQAKWTKEQKRTNEQTNFNNPARNSVEFAAAGRREVVCVCHHHHRNHHTPHLGLRIILNLATWSCSHDPRYDSHPSRSWMPMWPFLSSPSVFYLPSHSKQKTTKCFWQNCTWVLSSFLVSARLVVSMHDFDMHCWVLSAVLHVSCEEKWKLNTLY